MGDNGAVTFNLDPSTGLLEIRVRAPLAILSTSVKVPVIDFLEQAAQVQLAVIAQTRGAMAQLRNGNGTPTTVGDTGLTADELERIDRRAW